MRNTDGVKMREEGALPQTTLSSERNREREREKGRGRERKGEGKRERERESRVHKATKPPQR